jgi:cell division protein FtsB
MDERRELLNKVVKQMIAISEFIQGIEKSLSIMVEMKSLEPQFRTVTVSMKQALGLLTKLHEESLIPVKQEQEEKETLRKDNDTLSNQLQKLSQEIKDLKTLLKTQHKEGE